LSFYLPVGHTHAYGGLIFGLGILMQVPPDWQGCELHGLLFESGILQKEPV
jgi:hypothetical protein